MQNINLKAIIVNFFREKEFGISFELMVTGENIIITIRNGTIFIEHHNDIIYHINEEVNSIV